MSAYNKARENGLGLGTGTADGSAPGTNSAPATDANQDPAAVDGLHALTVHGFSPLGPDEPADATTQSVAPSSVPAGAVNGFDFDGYTHAMQNVEDPTGNPNAVSPTGAYGLSQFTSGTWTGLRNNYPGLGLPASPQQATAAQQANATNSLTAENVNALQRAGIQPSFASAYLAHNAGISDAISTFKASDDTPISSVIAASTIAVNNRVYGGVQTVGDLKSRLASLMGGAGNVSAAAPTQNAAPAGPAPNTFSGAGFNFSDAQAGLGNDPALSAQAPSVAPAPVTTTTMQPSPYAATPEQTATINADGYDATPVNGLAYSTFGPQVGYSVASLPGYTPIGEAVPASVMAAHPEMFSGVQTVGDLRANIANIAATAGPQTAVTSTAPQSAISPSVAAALKGIGAYTGNEDTANLGGAPQSFGLGLMGGMAPTTTNELGGLGMVGYDGTSQVAHKHGGLRLRIRPSRACRRWRAWP